MASSDWLRRTSMVPDTAGWPAALVVGVHVVAEAQVGRPAAAAPGTTSGTPAAARRGVLDRDGDELGRAAVEGHVAQGDRRAGGSRAGAGRVPHTASPWWTLMSNVTPGPSWVARTYGASSLRPAHAMRRSTNCMVDVDHWSSAR